MYVFNSIQKDVSYNYLVIFTFNFLLGETGTFTKTHRLETGDLWSLVPDSLHSRFHKLFKKENKHVFNAFQ